MIEVLHHATAKKCKCAGQDVVSSESVGFQQDGLEDPANSDFLAQLYQALLIGAMEASNAIVPAVSTCPPSCFRDILVP